MVKLSAEAEVVLTRCLKAIEGRAVIGGGSSGGEGGGFRPDATAWAVIAQRAAGTAADSLYPAREKLAKMQASDGSVRISPDFAGTIWPTPLAVLAWQGEAPFAEAGSRATNYLLASGGLHRDRRLDDAAVAVNPRLRGWAWVTGTFSWVEPTAMAMMALSAAGHSGHPRVREGVAMLLDRQVREGGWNFGETRVYQSERTALPETTGLVMVALRDHVPRETMDRAIVYVRRIVGRHRTPLALGWCLLGLAAWGEEPEQAFGWIAECLDRQSSYGPYDTTHIALLALACMAHNSEVGPLFSGVRQ